MEKKHHARRLPDHPAFRPPPKNHARQLLALAISWAVLLAIAGAGVYVWQQGKAHHLQDQVNTLRSQLFAAQAVSLRNNPHHENPARVQVTPTVSLMLSDGWRMFKGTGCPPSRPGLVCAGKQVIAPKTNTRGDLAVDVTAYQNSQNSYAKSWFLNAYGGGGKGGEGEPVEERVINGHSAAYVLQGAGGSPQDVYYVVSAQAQSVVVHARVFTKDNPDQDFRQYLPTVQQLAAAIQFEDGHEL